MSGKVGEGVASPLLRPPEDNGQIDRVEWSAIADTGERLPCVYAGASQKPGPTIAGENRGHQAMMGEHVIDRLVLVFPQSLEHDARKRPAGIGQEQLGDNLIGTAQVQQLDPGEVEECGEAIGGGERGFDPGAYGGTSRAGDQIAVGCGDSLTEEVSHPNRFDHQASAS